MGRLRFELRTNRLKAALEYPEGAAIADSICGWYEESTADNIRQPRTGSAISATARDVRLPAYGWRRWACSDRVSRFATVKGTSPDPLRQLASAGVFCKFLPVSCR